MLPRQFGVYMSPLLLLLAIASIAHATAFSGVATKSINGLAVKRFNLEIGGELANQFHNFKYVSKLRQIVSMLLKAANPIRYRNRGDKKPAGKPRP